MKAFYLTLGIESTTVIGRRDFHDAFVKAEDRDSYMALSGKHVEVYTSVTEAGVDTISVRAIGRYCDSNPCDVDGHSLETGEVRELKIGSVLSLFSLKQLGKLEWQYEVRDGPAPDPDDDMTHSNTSSSSGSSLGKRKAGFDTEVTALALVDSQQQQQQQQRLQQQQHEQQLLRDAQQLYLKMQEDHEQKQQQLQLQLQRDREEMETQLKAQMEAQLKAQMEAQLKAQMEAQLKAQMETQLKAQMEIQMQAERKKIYEGRLKQIQDSKRSYECAICYQEQSLAYSLSCSHTFCLPCIRALPPLPVPASSNSNLTKNIKCPTCQVPTPLDGARRSLLVDEQVEKLLREEWGVLGQLGREGEGRVSLDRWLQEQAEKRAEEKAWIQERQTLQQQQQQQSAVVTAGPKKAKDAKEKKKKAPKPQPQLLTVPVPAPALPLPLPAPLPAKPAPQPAKPQPPSVIDLTSGSPPKQVTSHRVKNPPASAANPGAAQFIDLT